MNIFAGALLKLGWRDNALLYRFASEAATRGFSVITLPLLTYFLGVGGYGRFSIAQSSVLALVPVMSLGIGFSLIRQIASLSDPEEIARKIGNALLIVTLPTIVLAGMIWLAAPMVASWFSAKAASVALIQAGALLLVASIWQGISHEALRARQRTAAVSILQITEAIGAPSVIVALIYTDTLTASHVILALAALKLVTAWTGISLTLSRRQITARSTWSLSMDEIKPLLAIGLPFMVAGFGEWLMGFGDRLVIGAVIGAGAVGTYVAGQVLVSVLSSWGAPFWWVLFPRLCASAQGIGKDEAHAHARQISTWFFKTGVGVASFLMIAGPALLTLLLHGKGVGNSLFLNLLIVAVFINQMATPWEYAIYMERQGALLMRATLLWGAIAIGLNFVLLPILGLSGAAVATLVGRAGFAVQIYRAAARIGHGRTLGPDRRTCGIVGGVLLSALAVTFALSAGIDAAVMGAVFHGLLLGGVFIVLFVSALAITSLKKS